MQVQALPRPSDPMTTPKHLKSAREAATTRFLAIAAALKAEAGVKEHKIRKSLTGGAWVKTGVIEAPEGRTRKQLYVLAHECAHVALKHTHSQPSHVKELEAERWAHAALRRHGVAVPRAMTKRAKRYVASKVRSAIRRGAKTIDSSARSPTLGSRMTSSRRSIRDTGTRRMPGGASNMRRSSGAGNTWRCWKSAASSSCPRARPSTPRGGRAVDPINPLIDGQQ